ncbi:twin-arginine translocation signal domain-containing protein [Natrialba sp. SSL1]|uniref:twin-arginine translocation signal domain-containing protein n=1 Tax=Natrialba sp. SSL1 TaxID=1869245 RepID=UPI0008F8EF48|nr:twin-arginine translocation signal domain-containing protein [Natrialba sp. SSL1]OIB59306.1 copper-binding protein [Natrialba sp. SSL1]
MAENNSKTRRTILKVAGAVGATAFLAGCADDNGNGEENGNGDEPAPDENGDENGNDEPDDENGEAIEPDTVIELDAQTAGWVGIEPEEIADEENPTLTLEDGAQYEIGWEEGDGSTHNIELVDEDDEVVDDYETDEADEGGDDQFIEFEATDDIAEYVCRPHEGTMRGTIEIVEAENGEADEDAEDEENGEEENGEEDNGNGDEENGNGNDNGDEENGNDDN